MLNSVFWSNDIANKMKSWIFKSLVRGVVILYSAETWTIGKQANILLTTKMDFSRRVAKKNQERRKLGT